MVELLEIQNLHKYFAIRGRWPSWPAPSYSIYLRAVDAIYSLKLAKGEFLGLMGNPYSGASIVPMIMTGAILPTAGQILFQGKRMFDGEHEIEEIREDIFLMCSYFQYPFRPPFVLSRHPLEMSLPLGEEKIKIIDEHNPKLLVADTSSPPSYSIKEEVLSVLMEKKKQRRYSCLLVTQDLGSIVRVCDRIAIMYAGKIVEYAETEEILKNPLHPYLKWALLYETLMEYTSIKSLERALGMNIAVFLTNSFRARAAQLRDMTVNLINPPTACRFHPRCPFAMDVCRLKEPVLVDVGREQAHFVACWHLGEI